MTIDEVVRVARELVVLPETPDRVAGVVEEASARRLADAVRALWETRGHRSWWSGTAWVPGRNGSRRRDILRLKGRRCETRMTGFRDVYIRPDIAKQLGVARLVVEVAFIAAVTGREYNHLISGAFFAPIEG